MFTGRNDRTTEAVNEGVNEVIANTEENTRVVVDTVDKKGDAVVDCIKAVEPPPSPHFGRFRTGIEG